MLKAGLFVVIGTVLENKVAREHLPMLYEPSPVFEALPRAFGILILVLTGFSMWLLTFGMKVGQARGKYKELAEKDGEKDLDRYSYPNLYVSGSSKHAIAFNNVQRAHQHVLEVIAQMYVAAIFSGIVYPLTASVSTCLWAYGRSVWSTKYADDGADGRYGHFMALWIWYGLIINYLMCFLVAANFVFGMFY